MLQTWVRVNWDDIDHLYCLNKSKKNKKGEHKYHCWTGKFKKKVTIWHNRDDGWEELIIKFLKKKEKEKIT